MSNGKLIKGGCCEAKGGMDHGTPHVVPERTRPQQQTGKGAGGAHEITVTSLPFTSTAAPPYLLHPSLHLPTCALPGAPTPTLPSGQTYITIPQSTINARPRFHHSLFFINSSISLLFSLRDYQSSFCSLVLCAVLFSCGQEKALEINV